MAFGCIYGTGIRDHRNKEGGIGRSDGHFGGSFDDGYDSPWTAGLVLAFISVGDAEQGYCIIFHILNRGRRQRFLIAFIFKNGVCDILC